MSKVRYGAWSMLSYPNMGGQSKELQHPNLVTLAKLAEKAGLDLRILVLTRDARDLLASTTEHRGFGGVNKQAEQLADNAAVLSSQLRLIDRSFVECMHLEQLGTKATWMQPRVQGAAGAAAVPHFSPPAPHEADGDVTDDDDDEALLEAVMAYERSARNCGIQLLSANLQPSLEQGVNFKKS